MKDLSLLLILAAALSLRLTFFTGLVHLDELAYARAANSLAHGHLVSGVDAMSSTSVNGAPVNTSVYVPVARRLTTYAPIGVAYRVFGVNDGSTAAWPLLCSLVTIVLVFCIARILCGQACGYLAAMLWAVLPLDIPLATNVLPDGPLAMFSAAAVLSFLRARDASGRRALAWSALSALCLVGAALAKQTGLVTAGLLIVLGAARWRTNRAALAGSAAAAVAGALMFYYHYKLSGMWLIGKHSGFQYPWMHVKDLTLTATDSFFAATQAPEMRFLFPLAIVAIAFGTAAGRRMSSFAAVWLGATFIYLELGTKDPFLYEPFGTEYMLRYSLFAMVPCVILIGSYFAMRLSPRQAAWTAAAISVGTAAAAWAGTRGAPTLPAWVLGQEDWTRPFATLSALAAIGTIYGGMASPAFVTGAAARWKTVGAVLLLCAVAIASLHPSYEGGVKYRMPLGQTTHAAVRYLADRRDLPWLAQHVMLADRLDYESQYRRGYDFAAPDRGTRLRVVPPTAGQVGSAYIFIDETAFTIPSGLAQPGPPYLRAVPPTWWLMGSFGTVDGYRLKVYRALTPEDAARELQEARASHSAHPDADSVRRLTGALANAGDYCGVARRAWAARVEAAVDLASQVAACYAVDPAVAGTNLLINGDFTQGLNGWSRPPAPDVDLQVASDAGDPMLSVTARSSNQRAVVLQGVRLQPSTPYVFEATFKTTARVVALYWESDVGRFDSETAFPEWTTRRYVFITPAWDGQPRAATVMPFLLSAPGQLYLKHVKLAQLRVD